MSQRGNIFVWIEDQYKFLNNEQRLKTAVDLTVQLMVSMEEKIGEDKAKTIFFEMLDTAITLGTEGHASEEEKSFIDLYMNKAFIVNPIKDEKKLYSNGVDDKDYRVAKFLSSNPVLYEWAMLYLRFIFCFAYSDGKFGDEVALRLEEMYSIMLIMEFAKSGLESVPAQTIGLYGLELEVAKAYNGPKKPGPTKQDIYSRFPGHSPSEIETALDSLCQKGVLDVVNTAVGKFYSPSGVNIRAVEPPVNNMKQVADASDGQGAISKQKTKAQIAKKQERRARAHERKENERLEQIEKENARKQSKKRQNNLQKVDEMIADLQNRIRDEESKTDNETAEISKKLYELKKELSSLGFFKAKEKKIIRESISECEKTLQDKKNDLHNLININEQKISKLKDVQSILDNNGSVIIQLGTEPYSEHTVPFEWKVVDNDGETLTLLSVKVIGIGNYMVALRWLEETVLEENFTSNEKKLIIFYKGRHMSFPNADKIQGYTESDLRAEPTDGLKSKLGQYQRITNYWLEKDEATQRPKSVVIERNDIIDTGFGVDRGIRPVIKINLAKYLDSIME